MQKIYFLFLMQLSVLFISSAAFSQPKNQIRGTVIDASSKEPLVMANIAVMGTSFGTSSDARGQFVIENIPVGTYRLQVSYIGYQTLVKTDVTVISASPAFVNIELTPTIIETQGLTVNAGYFVEEEKTQPSTIELSREEIRRFPGGFEDVVRTVSTLPGVAINASGGRNDLLVRGGGPSENLYIINNIEVPNINHFGTQGNSSGSLSFLNLDFVEDVRFSTGGFGAQYGDKMSSVLSLSMSDKRPEKFRTKTTLSATQYGFQFDAPLANKGNLIFSARKSYLDLIFKAAGLPFVPVYTDFNILVNYDLSEKDKLFILGLSAINEVDRDQSTLENRVTNAGLLDNSQYQGISGLDYRRLLDNGYLDVTLGFNLFRYRFKQLDEKESVWFQSHADEWETTFKIQNYRIISQSMGLRSGVSMKSVRLENTTQFADSVYDRSGNRVPVSELGYSGRLESEMQTAKLAGFTELDWAVRPKFDINLGLRADRYNFIDEPSYVSPRASLKWKATVTDNFRLSGGVYYQSPSYVWISNAENRQLKALRNRMVVIAWDHLIREDLRMSIESYYKRYDQLPTGTLPGVNDYIVITNTGTGFGGREDDFQSFGYFPLTSKGTGKAYGAEFLLQKKFSDTPLYGLLSFTYGKSEVTAGDGNTYPNQYDQRLITNLSGGYIFNSKWEVAAKFRYFTGVPYTPVYRPSQNQVNPGTTVNLPEDYLKARTKAGHHLDIRVDRYFNFKAWTLIAYLDIQNIYNYKIPQKPTYDFWADTIKTSSDIGILPSVGMSVKF